MKFLKCLAIIGALLISTTMITSCVNATAPRYIGLQYNAQTNTLKVKVLHISPAPKIHYVYRIEIDKNGEVYQAYLYQKQPKIFLSTYTYNVTVSAGDTITVSAYCMLWGFLQKSQTITNSLTIS
jgi:hypothetical protein